MYITPMTTATKVVGFEGNDDSYFCFIPLENFPTIHCPYDCTYKRTTRPTFVGVDGYFELVSETILSPFYKEFQDGEAIKLGDPIFYYESTASSYRPVVIRFYNNNNEPVSHSLYTGFPIFKKAENAYYFGEDNIYECQPSFFESGSIPVVWSFGGYGQTGSYKFGEIRNKFDYVPYGSINLTPPDTGDYVPYGWVNSNTMELYNGEAITEKTILSAVYDSFSSNSVKAFYKDYNGFENSYILEKEYFPYMQESAFGKRYCTIVPRCRYTNIECQSLYDAHVSNIIGSVIKGYGATLVIYSNREEINANPIPYPMLKGFIFDNKEVNVYYYNSWYVKIFESGETSPPFNIKDGYYIDWSPQVVSNVSASSSNLPVVHDVVINRGSAYLGVRGAPVPPSGDDDSIIPILYYLSIYNNSNFDKFNKIFP